LSQFSSKELKDGDFIKLINEQAFKEKNKNIKHKKIDSDNFFMYYILRIQFFSKNFMRSGKFLLEKLYEDTIKNI
jgi:hypothetical protein